MNSFVDVYKIMGKDYYKILDILCNVSEDEIRKVYWKMVLKYYLDKNKSIGVED